MQQLLVKHMLNYSDMVINIPGSQFHHFPMGEWVYLLLQGTVHYLIVS